VSGSSAGSSRLPAPSFTPSLLHRRRLAANMPTSATHTAPSRLPLRLGHPAGRAVGRHGRRRDLFARYFNELTPTV
jgi:hypothetical protein